MEETKKQLKEKADKLLNQLVKLSFKELACHIFGGKEELKELQKKTDRINAEYEELKEKIKLLESPIFNPLPDLSTIIKDLDLIIKQRDLIRDVQENEMMFCFRTQQLEHARYLIELANQQIKSKLYV